MDNSKENIRQETVITKALDLLFLQKRIFCSEADFQFALAWTIKELYPDADIRLEYIPWEYDKNMHIDIVVFMDKSMIPIELKYKTKGFSGYLHPHNIYLKNHSARDAGRYDFLLDIKRMEKVADCGIYPIRNAFVIFLTNDPGYWDKPFSSRVTVDDEFRIHDGAVIYGERQWKVHAGEGTKRGREKSIALRGKYKIDWNDYIPISACSFKFTIVNVQSKES